MMIEPKCFAELEQQLSIEKINVGASDKACYEIIDIQNHEDSTISINYQYIQSIDAVLNGRYHFMKSFQEILAKKHGIKEFVKSTLRKADPHYRFEAICLSSLVWKIIAEPSLSFSFLLFVDDKDYSKWERTGESNNIEWISENEYLCELLIGGHPSLLHRKDGFAKDVQEFEIIKKRNRVVLSKVNQIHGHEEAVIPSEVTEIGICAFFHCVKLKKIWIPSSVNTIQAEAFFECTSLNEICIPKGVKCIPSRAFFGCINLKKIKLPNGITSIGYSAFFECKSLTEIELPDSVCNIEANAFYGCSSLRRITIPNGVRIIPNSAFEECSSLADVSIPKSVEIIMEKAFYNCNQLKSITLPEKLTTIGKKAFYSEEQFRQVLIPANLKHKTKALEASGINTLIARFYGQISLPTEQPVTLPAIDEIRQEANERFNVNGCVFEVQFVSNGWLDSLISIKNKLALGKMSATDLITADHVEPQEAAKKYTEFIAASLLFAERAMMEKVLESAPKSKTGKLCKGRVQQLVFTGLSVNDHVEELYAKSITDASILIMFRQRESMFYPGDIFGKTGRDYLK